MFGRGSFLSRHFRTQGVFDFRRHQPKKHLCSAVKFSDSIIITKIKPKDYMKLTEFLLLNFYQYEPMGVVLGLNVEKEVSGWLHKWVKAHLSLSPPVSSQAIDTKTGKMIGVHFCTVVDPRKPPPPLQVDFVNAKTQPIKAQICRFLDEIEEGIDAAEFLGLKSLSSDYDPKTLDSLMISVHKDYWNRGLSSELIKNSEANAVKVKNCTAAKVVVTSEWSYKAFLKRDYQVIREFQYEIYKDADGVKIFQGKQLQLGHHTSSRVMIKDLSSQVPPPPPNK